MAATSFPSPSHHGILRPEPWPSALLADTGRARVVDEWTTDPWSQRQSMVKFHERHLRIGHLDRERRGDSWSHPVLHLHVHIRSARRISGPIQFVHKLLKTWKLDRKHAAKLLGFGETEADGVYDLLEGRAEMQGRDIRDRIASLYQIRKLLHSLFQNEDVENEWLRERHHALHDQSPMELLLEGSMENILYVRDYVEAAAGL